MHKFSRYILYTITKPWHGFIHKVKTGTDLQAFLYNLILLLFQFLQLLEQVCFIFIFSDDSGSKMKIKKNSKRNEYQQTTTYACNIHCGNITIAQGLFFFFCCFLQGFFFLVFFGFFLNIVSAVHVCIMTAHT